MSVPDPEEPLVLHIHELRDAYNTKVKFAWVRERLYLPQSESGIEKYSVVMRRLRLESYTPEKPTSCEVSIHFWVGQKRPPHLRGMRTLSVDMAVNTCYGEAAPCPKD